ncbi:MAG: hypothetical protein HQ536_02905 [Parcubacteria group bacterium]|nr:hypothetical protein [Parcubacteria group bacterium]
MLYLTALTAATLKAILCYIDPEKTPKIAFDDDSFAEELGNKIKEALGDRDGSQTVTICFNNGEKELKRQFDGVCKNIKEVFKSIVN